MKISPITCKTSHYGFLSVLFVFFLVDCYSQDIIIKKNNEQIKVKILEIGTDEVKFKYWDTEDGPTVVMRKDDIKSMTIKGKNNTQNTIGVTEDPMSVSNNKILDKTSSFKFNFFSPLFHNAAFSYEWVQKPGFNLETGFGIIGLGVGSNNRNREVNIKPRGGFIKIGAKFLLGNSSDYAVEGLKYAHPLKGRYVKIEVILNSFVRSSDMDTNFNYTSYLTLNPSYTPAYVHIKKSFSDVALNLIYGRQYILGNSITAGYYAGIGYGFESETSNFNTSKYIFSEPVQRYSHFYFGKDFPVVMTFGLNIGIVLKAPKKLIRNSDEENKYWIDKKGARQNPKKIQ